MILIFNTLRPMRGFQHLTQDQQNHQMFEYAPTFITNFQPWQIKKGLFFKERPFLNHYTPSLIREASFFDRWWTEFDSCSFKLDHGRCNLKHRPPILCRIFPFLFLTSSISSVTLSIWINTPSNSFIIAIIWLLEAIIWFLVAFIWFLEALYWFMNAAIWSTGPSQSIQNARIWYKNVPPWSMFD